MRTVRLTLMALVTLAVAVVGMPTAEGAPAKVEVCHVDDDGAVRLITISERAFETHVAHGDAAPGDPVPGMSNHVFDESCTPTPVETVFAVAYSDVVDDGDGYDPDVDVLISKLVDANGSGVPDAGDKVITDRYPLDFDAATFGNFTVTEHVIDSVTGAADRCEVFAANGDEFRWLDFFQGEGYSEARLFNGRSAGTTNILNALVSQSDLIVVSDTPLLSPSRPDPLVQVFRPSTGNVGFLDVEFDCAP